MSEAEIVLQLIITHSMQLHNVSKYTVPKPQTKHFTKIYSFWLQEPLTCCHKEQNQA